ncbi:hypothetical protein LguiA_033096 [Lonicera macranthoides]
MGRGDSNGPTPRRIQKIEEVQKVPARSEDLSRNGAKSEDLSRNDPKSEDLSRNDPKSKYDELIIDIEKELNGINPIQLSERCIYRVPTQLRKLNEEAYTPRIVSIRPFHHGAEAKLVSMEDLKSRYFKKFVRGSFVSLSKCIEFLKDSEGRAREFYKEVIYMDSIKFVHMLLVDGCFILELLLKSNYPSFRDDEDTYVLSTPWLLSDLKLDLILLENHIPFFVLEGLYNLANATSSMQLRQLQSLQYLTLGFFENVTKLDEAGVKFQVSEKKCLLDVKFKKPVLEIPCIKLNDHTETLIRNLMPLELCHYPKDSYIIDYILFMDYLINTPKDVDLLVQNGILANWLGDSKAAARLVNKLCQRGAKQGNSFPELSYIEKKNDQLPPSMKLSNLFLSNGCEVKQPTPDAANPK